MTRSHREPGPARALPRPALLLAVAAALALAAPAHPAAAQDTVPALAASDSMVVVQLRDGSVIYGRIVAEDAESITLLTQGGTRVPIRRDQVHQVRAARGRMAGGEFWGEDPHATRLFFGPTARSLDRGQGYFGVFELLFPFVAYGVTDRVTVAGGTPILPEVIGRVLYLAPKVEVIRTPRASFAVGALALFATQEVDEGSIGIAYGVGTFGKPDRSVTVGAGFPFLVSDDENDLSGRPLLMLGGESRIGRRTKLISENYLSPGGEGAVLSGGVRFFGDRLSADAGIAAWMGDEDSGCCFPLVNFVYSFGGTKD